MKYVSTYTIKGSVNCRPSQPFPLGWVYPSRYRNRAAERVGCITGLDLTNSESADVADLNMAENHVTRNALECAQLICAKLKDSGRG